MGDVIRLADVTLGYDRHPAVHHVSGAFRDGSLTAVVGPNGAGKSTLLKAMAGLLRPMGGRIERPGVQRCDLAYLPQQADIDRTFPIRVLDCVQLGHWHRVGPFGRIGRGLRDEAAAALAAVGLAGFEDRAVGTLSAGQFQRVLFARMMLQDARVILLDEPFNALDQRTTADLLRLVARWHGERRTVVAVLHDLDQVRAHFPETLLLARDPIAWGATAEVLTADRLARAKAMAEAWDDAAEPCGRAA
jgi:zinc/manganese transport system ATP-binding protein